MPPFRTFPLFPDPDPEDEDDEDEDEDEDEELAVSAAQPVVLIDEELSLVASGFDFGRAAAASSSKSIPSDDGSTL